VDVWRNCDLLWLHDHIRADLVCRRPLGKADSLLGQLAAVPESGNGIIKEFVIQDLLLDLVVHRH
tara:strand:+ start:921 stop:1115 length:195 start_codon:yes stop_codon:yes gene_type:complete